MSVIDKRTKIAAMLQAHPQTATVLKKYRLGCIGCHGVQHESVEQGAIAHGVDLNAFLQDLNAAIKG